MTIAAGSSPAGVRLSVRDSGPGIPSEDLLHLFDRFWRTEKSRNRSSGGSGLAIVKQLAEAHGGRALVESAPEEGTRFTVLLPV